MSRILFLLLTVLYAVMAGIDAACGHAGLLIVTVPCLIFLVFMLVREWRWL